MKILQRITFILFIAMLQSCHSGTLLTEQEKILINNGNENEPFRVLLTTNEQDSLFLRQVCKPVSLEQDGQNIRLLIARLKATLEAENGVGIAAPQVGIGRNIFLFIRIDKPDMPVEVAINPRIVNHSDEKVCFEGDGCLSIPDVSGNSLRYPWVEVEYTNEQGERVSERLEGYSRQGNFVGVIFQHEYDHLQGVLFTDKLCD